MLFDDPLMDGAAREDLLCASQVLVVGLQAN